MQKKVIRRPQHLQAVRKMSFSRAKFTVSESIGAMIHATGMGYRSPFSEGDKGETEKTKRRKREREREREKERGRTENEIGNIVNSQRRGGCGRGKIGVLCATKARYSAPRLRQ